MRESVRELHARNFSISSNSEVAASFATRAMLATVCECVCWHFTTYQQQSIHAVKSVGVCFCASWPPWQPHTRTHIHTDTRPKLFDSIIVYGHSIKVEKVNAACPMGTATHPHVNCKLYSLCVCDIYIICIWKSIGAGGSGAFAAIWTGVCLNQNERCSSRLPEGVGMDGCAGSGESQIGHQHTAEVEVNRKRLWPWATVPLVCGEVDVCGLECVCFVVYMHSDMFICWYLMMMMFAYVG